jgi:hypothetical protein
MQDNIESVNSGINPVTEIITRANEQMAFEALTDIAVNVCLTDPEAFQTEYELARKRLQGTELAEHYRSVGLWGIRASVELTARVPIVYSMSATDDLSISSQLLTQPDLLAGSADVHAQATFEAFGKILLNEAFLCLGADANDQLEQFKNAATDEDREPVINWLLKRVVDIRDKPLKNESEEDILIENLAEIVLVALETDLSAITETAETIIINDTSEEDPEVIVEEDQSSYFYHPVRLSPKFIGKYPNVALSPTCLSVSILLASFFEKAGVEYMHAGVARTAGEHAHDFQAQIVEVIREKSADMHIPLSNEIDDLLTDMYETYVRRLYNDRGVHANIVIKRIDDGWTMLDPNYKCNRQLHEIDSQNTTTAFDIIKDLHESGVDIQTHLALITGHSSAITKYLVQELVTTLPGTEEAALVMKAALMSDQPEEHLVRYLSTIMFDDLGSVGAAAWTHLENIGRYYEKDAEMDYITNSLLSRMERFMFPDILEESDYEKVFERCRTDAGYRQRRIEDLRLMPLFAALGFITDELILIDKNSLKYPPASLEIGMPVSRIGAMVLSDFGFHFDDDLSQDFWVRNVPSHVSLFGHLPDTVPQDAQLARIKRFQQFVDENRWQYFSSYGIIDEFLEQGESS